MFHAIALFFLGLTGTLPMATPAELAAYTKCQPDRISHWIGQRITYKKTKGWESAETCMARGDGDCKCMAIVAQETLNTCAGVEARIVVLKDEEKQLHAITLYTDAKGGRGFINEMNRERFAPGTDWKNIVDDVSGGPWTIVEMYAAGNNNRQGPVPAASVPALATAEELTQAPL